MVEEKENQKNWEKELEENWDYLIYHRHEVEDFIRRILQEAREEERERIEILLKWLIEDTKKYQEALKNKGMFESVETLEYVKQTIQQFLENPKKIDWIVNNSSVIE